MKNIYTSNIFNKRKEMLTWFWSWIIWILTYIILYSENIYIQLLNWLWILATIVLLYIWLRKFVYNNKKEIKDERFIKIYSYAYSYSWASTIYLIIIALFITKKYNISIPLTFALLWILCIMVISFLFFLFLFNKREDL